MQTEPNLVARVALVACAILVVVLAYSAGLLTDIDERDPAKGSHLPLELERRLSHE